MTYNKPLPTIRPWTKEFWKAASEGELLLQRGKESGVFMKYPKKYSTADFNEELEWVKASGKGKIYSYSIVHRNPPSSFMDELPLVVAIVELEEGVRMCTNIVDTDFDKLACDVPVEAVFKEVNDEIGLVYFKVVK